jgi:hypothetical protein
MSMRDAAEQYLTLPLRRSLGYKMAGSGRLLVDFADVLDSTGQPAVTIEAALEWATGNKDATPGTWRDRLSVARGFARHMHALDPQSQVIPADLIPVPVRRKPPYLYSAEDVAALVHAAGTLTAPAAAAAIQALIQLIAASGMFSRGRSLQRKLDPLVCPAQRLAMAMLPSATGVVQVCHRRVVALMWLSCVMSSRLAARAALRS